MLHGNLVNSGTKIIKQRNIFLVISCVMLLSNIALAVALLRHDDKLVLIPPEINKSFWVKSGSVSREYLEEMTIFIGSLILDQTPLSSDFRRDVILKYVSPDYYNILFQHLEKDASYIKEQNISTKFNPLAVSVDEKEFKAILKGEHVTYVTDHKTSSEVVSYIAEFEYSGYKLLLKSFEKEKK